MPGQPSDPSERHPEATPEVVEEFGPLTLQRLVKDDGRALILFRRREPSDDESA